MKFVLGIKQNMTQVFDEEGNVHPVTVLSTGPMVVTQVKSVAKDGYAAVQVGFGEKKSKNINKALRGHMKDLGSFRYLKEFPIVGDAPKVGDAIDSAIAAGDKVVVSSISKGKGFQGAVKRHGFKGGPRTHGQKHSEREPGSISGGLRSAIRKGMRMAGRMGNDRITVKNIKVIAYDKEAGQLLVEGAVPGRRGTLVEVIA